MTHRYIIHDCLDHGTQIPYIRQAIKVITILNSVYSVFLFHITKQVFSTICTSFLLQNGYGVVVTNTNQNKALVGNKGKKTYKSIKVECRIAGETNQFR